MASGSPLSAAPSTPTWSTRFRRGVVVRRVVLVELVDALIRIFDYVGAYGYDLEGAYREKRARLVSREQ